MEFYLLPIFAFLCLALALSHASLPSEVYWQKALPNTPMPKAIRDLLQPTAGSDKSGWLNTNEDGDGGDGDGGDGGNGNAKIFFHYYLFHYDAKSATAKTPAGDKPTAITPTGGKSKPLLNTNEDGNGDKLSDVYRHIISGDKASRKNLTAASVRFHDELIKNNVGNFFLEKDLHRGATMKLYFTKTHKGATFFPRQVADSIPFSSNKLPKILNQFSVKPKSVEAEVMKDTIVECERPGNEGEDKYCATSLESLIDIAASELGNNNKSPFPLTTEVDGSGREEYKIGGVVKMGGDKAVACHKMTYPYAVFYCHATHGTKTYVVNPLVVTNNKADEKTKGSKAVAICHLDTSAWDPNHLAFQVLKIKPGTAPVCHFLPNGHIAWVPIN